jgi:hypothetical protein
MRTDVPTPTPPAVDTGWSAFLQGRSGPDLSRRPGRPGEHRRRRRLRERGAPMDAQLDTVIVGGGRAALALGRRLRRQGGRVAIVTAEDDLEALAHRSKVPVEPGGPRVSVRRDQTDGFVVDTGRLELSTKQVVVATGDGGPVVVAIEDALDRQLRAPCRRVTPHGARRQACVSTSSSIASVSLPVKVFC